MHEKILAIIPARSQSKGLQKKNIKLLLGKPMIVYTIEAALGSKYVNRIVISTEDKEIAKLSKKYSLEVIDRPKELAKDRTPSIDVIFHTLNTLKENYVPDIVILLQPTTPLRNTKDVDNALAIFLRGDCESILSVCETKKSTYWSLKIEDNFLMPIFGEEYMKIMRQDLPKAYVPNGAIYISKPGTLRKYESFYCPKTIPYIMPSNRSVDVDNEIDFMLAELLIKKYGAEQNRSVIEK